MATRCRKVPRTVYRLDFDGYTAKELAQNQFDEVRILFMFLDPVKITSKKGSPPQAGTASALGEEERSTGPDFSEKALAGKAVAVGAFVR